MMLKLSKRRPRAFLLASLFIVVGIAKAGAGGPPVPDPMDLITLVRQSVLAVDIGNKTGDYSALSAMGSADFQAQNPGAALASHFAKLRAAGVDLAAAGTIMPQTTRPPTLDANGLLRILGYFEFPDRQIVYDLLYTYDDPAKLWRLAGMSIEPRKLPPQPELIQPR